MPSPSIRINGGSPGVKASVSASSSVTATLDSTDGVRSVTWSVLGTDETATSASYTLVQSGSVGQTVTFTSGAAGTAGILRSEINGGVNLQTEQADPTTRATAKWYVPTSAGVEVGCVNEELESNATHGWTGLINAIARGLASTSAVQTTTATAAYGQTVRCDPTSAGFTVNLPTAVGKTGVRIIVKNTTASTNTITLDGNASETIDGSATFAMSTARQCVTLESDGANWLIISTYP
ncbi:hypothetical protein WMF38_57235 [Sorangium sp. So ce118]